MGLLKKITIFAAILDINLFDFKYVDGTYKLKLRHNDQVKTHSEIETNTRLFRSFQLLFVSNSPGTFHVEKHVIYTRD